MPSALGEVWDGAGTTKPHPSITQDRLIQCRAFLDPVAFNSCTKPWTCHKTLFHLAFEMWHQFLEACGDVALFNITYWYCRCFRSSKKYSKKKGLTSYPWSVCQNLRSNLKARKMAGTVPWLFAVQIVRYFFLTLERCFSAGMCKQNELAFNGFEVVLEKFVNFLLNFIMFRWWVWPENSVPSWSWYAKTRL